MRPSGALPTAEAAWATPGRELAAVVRGGRRASPRPDGSPAGTPEGTARPAASQTRRRRDAAGVAAATDTQLRVSRDAPAALGNQPAASAAACSDAGREHGLLALAGQIGSSQGPRGRLLLTQACHPARAILTPTATGLAPKTGRQDASTLFPELRSLKQAPPSGLPTGLDQGQEPGWTVATVPEVELQEAAGRGSWSLLSLSPSAPRLPFCQFERGFCHLPPRVTTSAGSHQDIRFPVLVTQGLFTFPPAERPPDTELIFSAQYQGHTQPCAGGGCGVERHRMGAPGSGAGEHSRASKVRSAQLALEASVSAVHASGGTHHRNDFDYLSVILASMDLRHRM